MKEVEEQAHFRDRRKEDFVEIATGPAICVTFLLELSYTLCKIYRNAFPSSSNHIFPQSIIIILSSIFCHIQREAIENIRYLYSSY
ncbi:putative integral membrane protein [Acanthocheilonema viteae]